MRCRLDKGPSKVEAEAAATVFQALTEGALKDAAECAHLDEEEGEAADDAGVGAMAGREDWFARTAAVGRASAAFSADLICAHIQRTQQHLLQLASAGSSRPITGFPHHQGNEGFRIGQDHTSCLLACLAVTVVPLILVVTTHAQHWS